MECDFKKKDISVCKTIFENFMEEKCECDVTVPDYYPAVEKIIHCKADALVTEKEISNDRLTVSGICRFSVLYMGEDGEEIRSLVDEARFSESYSLKDIGTQAWVQTVVRTSGVSCRVMNSKKINVRATVSVAIKVKSGKTFEVVDKPNCDHIETLYEECNTYTVYGQVEEHVKVQGGIQTHTDVHAILESSGNVCIKDIKVLPGKAVLKGILNLYVLFSPIEDPCRIENTSTAIPFTQVIEIPAEYGENVNINADSVIQNIKLDVESDPEGKNRTISVSTVVQTEGEIYGLGRSAFLVDVYSNRYPLNQEQTELVLEELLESLTVEEFFQFELESGVVECRPIQMLGIPYIRKVSGKEDEIIVEGVLDLSVFLSADNQYRNLEKSCPFTIKKKLKHIGNGMRCEIKPCVLGMEWMVNQGKALVKAELQCMLHVYEKKERRVIGGITVDEEHPLECAHRSSLVVYYAEKGERVWDIARKYHTSVQQIKELNQVNAEVLNEKQLLLIS